MICKEELVKRFDDYVRYFNAYCTSDAEDHEMLKAVLALLKEQEVTEQISDAIHETAKQFRQTIVRCKDCQYAEQTMFDDEYCCYYDEENESGCKRLHKGNFFCADGKQG